MEEVEKTDGERKVDSQNVRNIDIYIVIFVEKVEINACEKVFVFFKGKRQ